MHRDTDDLCFCITPRRHCRTGGKCGLNAVKQAAADLKKDKSPEELRGDVTNNVEFARQKAQEVFVEGNIPICPHLLFPPVADPTDPAQDEKARAMGLRLLESCQQMNVYGPVWTDGMWQEIYKAGELGIPVLTDQKTIGRTPPARRLGRKER